MDNDLGALQAFSSNINSESFKIRKKVIEDAISFLKKSADLNEDCVKYICLTIKQSIHLCIHKPTEHLLSELIEVLVEKNTTCTLQCFIIILSKYAKIYKNIAVTNYTTRTGLVILKWTGILFSNGYKYDEKYLRENFSLFVEIQADILASVSLFSKEKYTKIALNTLNTYWNDIPGSEIMYMDTICNMEINENILVLAAAIINRFRLAKNNDQINSRLETLLNAFIKFFINCKKRPSPALIVACYPLLKEVNDDLFGKVVAPSLQKTILRNPELTLEAIGYVITGINQDLNMHALIFGESLIVGLHSNDVQVRSESAEVCKKLAQKISDPKTVEELLKKTFGVFNGSNGKLTVVEQKVNVLQGAGNFSYNKVKNEVLDELISKVTTYFLAAFDTEVHEKVLCHALDMASLWLSRRQKKIPEKLIPTFKSKMQIKTPTPVRTSFIRCMLKTFNDNDITDCADLIPLLVQAVERAIAQSTQPAFVIEGLCAVSFLLKIEKATGKQYDKYQTIWNAILDPDKQIFTSEKFLSTCGDQGLIYMMEMCEILLLNFTEKIKGKSAPLYKSILMCCTLNDSVVRKNCLSILKNIVTQSNDDYGVKIMKELIVELQNMLPSTTSSNHVAENGDASDISSHILKDCVMTLCSKTFTNVQDFETFAVNLLPLVHQNSLVSVAPELWAKIIRHNKLIPKDVIRHQASPIMEMFVENYKASKVNENVLATLVKHNPDVILPPLIKSVTKKLSDLKSCPVSRDDYFIFLTPSDELYDKSVLLGNDDQTEINMKRESKVYSYKEQLEEIQLRRELEEKRRKQGKIKTPQYTPKQLEAINNQKSKEAAIRNRLFDMNDILTDCISTIRAASKGNPTELSLYFKDLLPIILESLHSPLSAPHLSALFTDLRKIVFTKQLSSLGDLISFVTLRLIKPECSIDPNWEAENLSEAVERVLILIHSSTVLSKNDSKEPFYFTAPAFCYSFYFLKSVLSNSAKNKEEIVHSGLQFISHHSKLRMQNKNGARSSYDPLYLPIKQLFSLLMQVISLSSGRVQTQAQSCLLDVANCVSGLEGCSSVTMEQLDVLLTALHSPKSVVRDTALRALLIVMCSTPSNIQDKDYLEKLSKFIWIARYDVYEENGILAQKLWESASLGIYDSLCIELIAELQSNVECVQLAASRALAALMDVNKFDVHTLIHQLLTLYKDHLKVIPAKLDEFGREIEKPIDIWYPRRGVALAIIELAPLITADHIGELIQFFVSTTLSDRNANVRKEMLNAALKIVDLHGKDTVSTLWPIFDNFMSKSSRQAHFDDVKQAVVILMGSLARHLDKEDPRIKPIVGRLIQALSTPSQTVQEAVANCLPHLISSVREESSNYINKLLHQLLKGDKYGERRGAAYGLAGLVKGLGILALKQHDIMTKLTDAIQDKKNYKHREGALFAFEMLFQMLGKLFEPYIVHVLPHLLQCFGDTSQYVRTAADDTAKVVMSKLSGHGVKLVLPSLLAALEEDSWRTKAGSVELLGDMAYCAPKQLSSCLPSIVPKLIEVLSDSHLKVQEAGAAALKVIGSVIRNPEIQAIVPVLLQALQDPSNKTSLCLQTLLDTQFVHFIDAPSLALIMPVVQRAFMDRSTETRKMAAQIIGNMYSLTDQKDLMPYLPTIIPGLKTSLLDPVPDVRSVSARALGAMVRGMGESSFEDLLPWLMQTLTSETSSVDRSGAAQGLSEVVGGLGVEKLHKLMPEIISTAERTDIAPHVKDGYIMMFIYMPVVFTNEFTPYIGQIINPILKALADENEYVRDTALKAGQRIVTLYADSAILLLLPELELGLFDDNWRIRYSSVQLLGDLLYRISGVTGKMSTETASEDDNFGTEQSHQAIINSLGVERRNRVLAGLYMGRSDVALMVRQAALHVWKVVVTNTPRTLREILPTLFSLLLGCLASESYDKRQVAARTLGDLVRKLGERVLPEIIPILEHGLQSDQSDQRQGVCIGLSEIMMSTSKDMVLTFVNSLVPTVRKALCDPLPEVRQAAAKTFDSLHATVGSRALDDILPTMLNRLNDDNPEVVEWTLDGLRQVMAIKSRVVLPYLVPQLTAPPANTKALSILASVAGEALNKYLPRILPALQTTLVTTRGTPEEAQQLEYCQTVILSVTDEVGIRTIIDTMLENTRNESPDQRRAAATLLCVFCANSKAQYTAHIPQLLRGLIHLCTDSDRDVLQMSWEALSAVIRTLEPKQQAAYVSDVRQSIRYAMSDMKGDSDLLPGFCLPKGITPILPIFRESILNGDGDEKEAAAQGLGEVIKVTSADALQPSVIAITGPLIRILGDRFNPNVKTSVLDTLAILLKKVGIMLKQFLPQLQTTFVKSLNDPNRTVRLKSANALSHLIVIHQRADPLFTELHNTIKNTDDSSIKETTLHALRGIITPAGDKMTDAIKAQIHSTLLSLMGASEDVIRNCAAGCLGALCKWLSPDQLDVTLNDHLLDEESNVDMTLKQGRAAALSVALKEAPERLWKDSYRSKIISTIISQLQSTKISLTQTAIRSSGYLFCYLMMSEEGIPNNLLVPFVRSMNNSSNEVKQLLAKDCIYIAKIVPPEKVATEYLKLILPMLVNGTKEKNSFVKANSEIALIAVLRLKYGDEMHERCLNILDVGARESLTDVITKVLRKIPHHEGKEEELDETLLT